MKLVLFIKMHFNLFLIFGLGLIFSACDCLLEANGKVVDSVSDQAIGGVEIQILETSDLPELTDTNGEFSISDINGGPNCKNLPLKFTKLGYKPLEIKIIGKGHVIKMEKL